MLVDDGTWLQRGERFIPQAADAIAGAHGGAPQLKGQRAVECSRRRLLPYEADTSDVLDFVSFGGEQGRAPVE